MHVLEIRNTPVSCQGIEEAATECLLKSPYHAVRKVFCQYDHGTLFLRGRLPSFHQKQVAQEAIARVEGVTQVINRIAVD
jgi:osmotically-inducible protein OsmY